MCRTYRLYAAVMMAFAVLAASGVQAQSPSSGSEAQVTAEPIAVQVPEFRLAADEMSTQTHVERMSSSGIDDWDIWGPVHMRSADPEPTGELEIKNIFDYGTSSDGTDDDFEYELELEWGFAPNHELIFETPFEIGDGAINGNGDITLGWHWRLWTEQDMLPAFAMRNYIRIPSGYDSSGVDYELRGLITKSIIPNQLRVHLNPFLKSVNGHNEEDHNYFQWGFIVGADYRLAENLVLNADYVHKSGETEGERNQHTMEVGLDWHFAENQGLGLAVRTGLDGDSIGENFGCAISYIYSFDNFPAFGR
ncbi:MAG: hypothetical protein JXA69_07170 [Phycisphaerae bacterium]|nr:hypothetical protein [Phycisphaerae bacterium]